MQGLISAIGEGLLEEILETFITAVELGSYQFLKAIATHPRVTLDALVHECVLYIRLYSLILNSFPLRVMMVPQLYLMLQSFPIIWVLPFC